MEHMCNRIISPGFFTSIPNFYFWVNSGEKGQNSGEKGQKMAQNDKKLCLLYSISQGLYLI